jgi:murein L,D-transpeptidase YcbB/YkuD
MKYRIIVLLIIIICSCNESKDKTIKTILPADAALIEPKIINHYYLDSLSIDSFLLANNYFKDQRKRIFRLYSSRNYQYVWFNNDGIIEQAQLLINQVNSAQFELADSLKGLPLLNSLYNQLSDSSNISLKKEIELTLSGIFFKYARLAWGGLSEDEVEDIGWYIKRKRLDYVSMLDSVLLESTFFTAKKPEYKQYGLLKSYLVKYRNIEKLNLWDTIIADRKVYKKGDSSIVLIKIKKRLYLLNDFKGDTASKKFDDSLVVAVKKYEHRYGLKEDGAIGPILMKELNRNIKYRIEQILVNMERARWVPVKLNGDYLVVNIPEFKLHVFQSDTLAWDCNVVVGSKNTKTIIFNGNLSYIIFSPYWNVPRSIIGNEIIPACRRNTSYIDKHKMEILGASGKIIDAKKVDWKKYNQTNFPYEIRQTPGPWNSLGKVKFLFPNNYSIYLHDTPSKYLFNENSRAFSHGCIRLGDPQKLAEWLLRSNTLNWNTEKIVEAMNDYKELKVTLEKPIPVFIAYFTCWVDRDGYINFRDDVYQHDERLKKSLLK